MNVFILTDLEGIFNVTDIDYMDREGEKFTQARSYLTEDLNRTAKICREQGAENIWYLDGHAGGGNIYADEVVDYCVKTDLAGWQKLVQERKIDCQIEIGGHAKAGTVGGFLDHTLNSRQFFAYKVNGFEASELYLHAAFLGIYDIPIVFFSGDDASCNNAVSEVPGIFCAPVKHAEKRNFCVMHENAEQTFSDTLCKALASWDKVPVLKIDTPVELELTYYRTDFCEDAFSRITAGESETVLRKDARTLVKRLDRIVSYDDLRF